MKLLTEEVIDVIIDGIKTGMAQSGLLLSPREEVLVESSAKATIQTIEKIIEIQD